MRKGISVATVVIGLWTAVSGIIELTPYSDGHPEHHVIPAVAFAIVIIIHAWLNRKPLFKYFKGLGWKWVWVGLGSIVMIAMIVTSVAHPS